MLTHAVCQMVRSAEAMRLDAMAAELQKLYAHPAQLVVKPRKEAKTAKAEPVEPGAETPVADKGGTIQINGPVALIDGVLEQGRKGMTIQRYKGLGEMNPEQLWATTLDPNVRTLLQVKVHHADEAGEIFSTLMGDLVEPRRDFIQANALKVANLDV